MKFVNHELEDKNCTFIIKDDRIINLITNPSAFANMAKFAKSIPVKSNPFEVTYFL